MSRFFLGQDLSERRFANRSPDPLRDRIWAALRYVTLVVSVIVAGILFGRSPGGALLVGIGGGAAVSGLLNILFIPRDERKQVLDLALVGGGVVAVAAGFYFVTG